jgi:transglutaminase-like putative cysteine protease
LVPTQATAKAYTITGDRDTQARLKVELIRRKVIEPALGPGPRGLAFTRGLLSQALNGAPRQINGHAKAKEAVWIFEWVRRRLRYVNDPTRKELFQQIPELFQGGIGDCDDYTAALAALLIAAGFKVQARLIELRLGAGWAHIYPRVWIPSYLKRTDGAATPVRVPARWVPLDATENHPAGWEAKHARHMDLELS